MAEADWTQDTQQRRSRTPVVSYDNVMKKYDDDVIAIRDFDLDISRGDFITFVGPSGCGKTTLLHLTAGLISPTEGQVEIDGTNVMEGEHGKQEVGLVFQQPVLLDWRTVLKNVLLPVEVMIENGLLEGELEEYRERAFNLLDLVGLEGFEQSYPNELSGGMQQRVSICRSLIYDPQILLMDEPFGALDAFTRDKLNEEILRIWRETQKTILFVTHNLEEAVFLSDYVVVLSARPGEILDVIEVDLPRTRNEETRTDERYHELVTEAYKHFKE